MAGVARPPFLSPPVVTGVEGVVVETRAYTQYETHHNNKHYSIKKA